MKRFPVEIKRILSTRDIAPKVICLLMAFSLYAYVNSTKIGDFKFRLPVELRNLPKNLIIVEGKNRYVTVTMTGRKDILKSLNIKNISASVNLQGYKIGVTRSYPIKLVKYGLPESVEVSVSKKELSFTIDRIISKEMPILPVIQKKLPEGYVLGIVKVDPPYVRVEGPEKIMREIESIKTEKIIIDNEKGRIEKEVSLNIENMEGLNISSERAFVVIPIIEKTVLSGIEVRINIRNPVEGYKYILSKQYTKIYLRPTEVEVGPSSDDIIAYVDISNINIMELFKNADKKIFEKELTVNIEIKKDGIEVITILPSTISVKIIRVQ